MSHEINTKLAVTTVEGNIRIWEISALINSTNPMESVSVAYDFILPSPITSLVVDKELSLGIAGVEDGTIHYIDFKNQEDNTRLISGGVGDQIITMDESDGILATGHKTGCMKIWNLEERELITNFEVIDGNEECTVVKCLKSIDEDDNDYLNDYVAAGYSKGTLRIFDLNKSELAIRVSPFNTAITALELSLDATIWVGCKNGTIALISLASGLTQRILTDHKGVPIDLISGIFDNISGKMMMVCGARDSRFSVWERGLESENGNFNLVDWISVATPPCYPDGEAFRLLENNAENDTKSMKSESTIKTSNKSSRTSHTKTSISSFNSVKSSSSNNNSSKNSLINTSIDYSRIPKCLLKILDNQQNIGIFTCYSLQKEIVFYSFSQKQTLRTIKIGHWANQMNVLSGNNYVVLAVSGGLLEVVDISSGHIHDISAHTGRVVSLIGTKKQQKILSASDAGELLVWRGVNRRREEKQVGFL